MEQDLRIPIFDDEAAEARWWAENQDRAALAFRRAADEGKLGRGTTERRGNTPAITIRLDPADLSIARLLAERKGLRYQTYLKMLLHEALQMQVEEYGRRRG